jgi:NADH-quinone oxidoreductase subunit L
LDGKTTPFTLAALLDRPQLNLMLLSTIVVGAALALGWRIYCRVAAQSPREKDPLEKSLPALFGLLHNKFFVDEIYAATVVRLNAAFSLCADWLDRVIWGGAVNAVSGLTIFFSRFNRALDESGINAGFDLGCEGLRDSGGFLSWIQNGRVQRYLRVVGLAVSIVLLALIWVCA